MARLIKLLNPEPRNAWANECRAFRLRTSATPAKFKGNTWPMDRKEFVSWTNTLVSKQEEISVAQLNHWERASYEPSEDVKNALRKVWGDNIHVTE